ncbi:prenyltransferase [Nocardia sp. CDC159]|uniref:Prenyltransferase n=1 Tax=Nocardia pulmonis TaxID=2951408 RepID=A0A9X2E2M3_9NOCA|nr:MULTISPECIES: prenyltransferase [Nocardia]MCM6773127.1 prenyltransferase [Nocardia pulmonis]MCM6785570.1 prenyltransferase [Nocardia sp. CDC159]
MGMNTTALGPDKLRGYARLGNLYFFDPHLFIFAGLSLLPTEILSDGRNWVVFVALSLGYFLVHHATASFDDITGFKDGSDARNYLGNPSYLRKAESKPLITGQLELDEARWCAWSTAIVGGVLVFVGFLLAPHHPVWLIAFSFIAILLCVQYSYGLNLSRIGGQELVLFFGFGLPVAVFYTLFSGTLAAVAVMQAVLIGLWAVLVSAYSNMNDLEVDRSNGRLNLATTTDERGYKRIVAILSVAEPVIVICFALATSVSWWYAVALIPVYALRLVQFRKGFAARDPLLARQYGRRIHELGIALLVVVNLVVLH